jgi:uroporphyrinogen-III synthase
VGAATAAAARDAGFGDVRATAAGGLENAGGTAQALVDSVAAAGFIRVLHLAGADRTPVTVPPTLTITTTIVYRADLVPLPAPPAADWVLLYSARTAAHFAAECDRLGAARATLGIAAISPAVATAAGPGWRRIVVAADPHEDALLAAIAPAWQKAPRTAASKEQGV